MWMRVYTCVGLLAHTRMRADLPNTYSIQYNTGIPHPSTHIGLVITSKFCV